MPSNRTPAQLRTVDHLAAYLAALSAAQADRAAGRRNSTAITDVLRVPNPKFPSFEFFCAESEPGIKVRKYAERLVAYLRCSPECFPIAAAYLRRAVDAGVPLTTKSAHRLLLTACVVAAKTRDDLNFAMSYYAQVGGVSTPDLNAMELRFLLDVLRFRADVEMPEYRAVVLDMARAALAEQQLMHQAEFPAPRFALPLVPSDVASLCGASSASPSTDATPRESPVAQVFGHPPSRLAAPQQQQQLPRSAGLGLASGAVVASAAAWARDIGIHW